MRRYRGPEYRFNATPARPANKRSPDRTLVRPFPDRPRAADSIANVAKAHFVRRVWGRIMGEVGRAAGLGIWPGGVHRAPTTSAGGAASSERQNPGHD